VCTFISTRDLVQEHIAYSVWPLVGDWEMPKEATVGSSQGGLVYLKYIFRYRDQFDEPNDEWLNCIEATSDELLGAYTRAEDDAMTLAFGGRGNKRLNRFLDVIGFVYPDYSYPSRKQERKAATSAISTTPKGKKIKVLTHWPRYIEMVRVLKLAEGTSSTAEPGYLAPVSSKGESAEVPEGQEKTESAGVPKRPAEAEKTVEELELEKPAGLPKMLSPLPEPELSKVSKAPAITPKRGRMASVLDTVLESTRASTPASARETAKAATTRADVEVGPSVPIATGLVESRQSIEQEPSDVALVLEREDASKKAESPTLEASTKELDFIIRRASGKKLSKEEIAEARHYAREVKYLKGSLVDNGTDEDDFLYYLPDKKEISVCREMARNIGFPKLEVGLSAMSKDDLADSLAYNSLKVHMLLAYEHIIFVYFTLVLILFLPFFVGLNPEKRFKGTEEC
jgi:hypothetical protein